MDFPTAPVIGQRHPFTPTPGVPVFIWDGEKWTADPLTGAVRYDVAQSLTAPQQAQARDNIAVTSGGGGSGDVTGPASAVADRIATFNGTTGKIIKDGGTLISALQPLDAELTAIAGLTSAADRLPYFTGLGTATLATFTSAARNLLDDADAVTMRGTLGLTSAATATPAALTKTDDTNVTLTLGGTPATALLAASSITAGWAGTLAAARGGFGTSVAASSGVPLFATGVPTFTSTTGTGNFVRAIDPALTGNPTAPTPAVGDNDTSIATTAFVRANAAPLDAMAYSGMQINGGMEVSQERGATAVVSAGNLAGQYIIDGFSCGCTTGNVVASTVGQVTDAPPGFNNSFKFTVTTGKASLAAADEVAIYTLIEGFRTARLAWGTSSAQPITLSFWCKTHRTGLYSGAITNGNYDRSYVYTWTQSVADTWEYKTVTIPGDTTGTWFKDNRAAIFAPFTIAAGTDVITTPGTWVAGYRSAATGTTNGVTATSDTYQITGVTVLPGTQAPTAAQSPNIMRPYDQELVTCKRYYEKRYQRPLVFSGYVTNGSVHAAVSTFQTSKRSVPTMSFADEISSFGFTALPFGMVSTSLEQVYVERTGTISAYGYFLANYVADARL